MKHLIITLILVATCNTAMPSPGSTGGRASGAAQVKEFFRYVCIESPVAISAPGTAIGSTVTCWRYPVIEKGRHVRKGRFTRFEKLEKKP